MKREPVKKAENLNMYLADSHDVTPAGASQITRIMRKEAKAKAAARAMPTTWRTINPLNAEM
jgi:hypothetical protein